MFRIGGAGLHVRLVDDSVRFGQRSGHPKPWYYLPGIGVAVFLLFFVFVLFYRGDRALTTGPAVRRRVQQRRVHDVGRGGVDGAAVPSRRPLRRARGHAAVAQSAQRASAVGQPRLLPRLRPETVHHLSPNHFGRRPRVALPPPLPTYLPLDDINQLHISFLQMAYWQSNTGPVVEITFYVYLVNVFSFDQWSCHINQ